MPDIAVLAELLDTVTQNNVFEFNGEHYLQIRGVPMGNVTKLQQTPPHY